MLTKDLLLDYGFQKSRVEEFEYFFTYPNTNYTYSLAIALKDGVGHANVCGSGVRTINNEKELKEFYLGVTGQELKYVGKYEYRHWVGNNLKVWTECDITEIVKAGRLEDYLRAEIIRKKR